MSVAAQRSSPLRVLIVGDGGMFVDLLRGALALCEGVDVVGTAGDASQASRVAVQLKPDVAVVAERTGDLCLSSAARVRQASPELRVVMVTDAGGRPLLRAAFSAGCAGVVTKDQSFAELVTALRAVQGGMSMLVDPKTIDQLVADRGPLRPDMDRGGLSRRELDVVDLLASGCSTREIADRLYISTNTARNHIQRILHKLGAHSRVEAVAIAARSGLVRQGNGD